MIRLIKRLIPPDIRGVVIGISSIGILSASKATLLLCLTFLASFFEGFSIAMILPILQFVEHQQAPEALFESSKVWNYIVPVFSSVGVPINLVSLILSVLFLLLIRQIFVYSRAIFTSRTIGHGIYQLRAKGFKSFLSADIGFFDNLGIGNLVNSMTLESLRSSYAVKALLKYVGALFLFLAYLVFMLLLNVKMTLLAMFVMCIVGVVVHKLIAKSRVIGLEMASLNSDFSKVLVEKFSGIRMMKLSATEKREGNWVNNMSRQLTNKQIHLDRLVARIDATIEPLIAITILMVLYISFGVLNLPLSHIGIFIFIMIRLLPVIQVFFKTRQGLATYAGSLESSNKIINEAQAADTIHGGTKEFQELKSNICFRDALFSYTDVNRPVLNKINVTIPAGKMTAIVGKSGAGKSTLVDLLPHLRSLSKGEILLDNIPIKEYSLPALRRAIAFVSQDSFLFDDSILENIKYGCPKATEEDVKLAAHNAYLDPLISSLPKGLHTKVGERAVKLSGGEKQRILLAGAMLSEASIIVLDEPTSSLDSESERYIQKALEGIRKKGNTTLIIIAHRLSTIQQADKIIVLEQGQVVEQGNHSELMHKDEWYADMVQIQSMGAAS